MKKKLTRIITLILTVLLLFSIGLTTSGCLKDQREKELNYMMNYMAKIPVEQTGYRISKIGNYPDDLLLLPSNGEFNINGIDFVIEGGIVTAPKVIINGETRVINSTFMRE